MTNIRLVFSTTATLIAIFNLISCQQAPQENTGVSQQARDLARNTIIVDGHVDLPYRLRIAGFQLEKEYIDVSQRTKDGNFDYVRAKEGGLDAPFMSIYIPASFQQTPGRAKKLADSLVNMVEGISQKYSDKFALAYTPDDIEQNFQEGKISLPMGMENGAPIEDTLENVQYFFDRGIRYITLTHSKDNLICDSSYDTTYTWNGLSPFGEKVVAEMNRLGIMVDISHVSDSTFYDVMEITQAPVIASHSSSRHFTPGFERNMADHMIRRLGKNGGVIQINFGSSFLDSTSQTKFTAIRSHISEWLKENDLSRTDSAAKSYIETYTQEQAPFSTVERVADHIDRIVKFAGIDHVGLGSDFDGVGNTLPTGLKDVSEYPNLIQELLDRGYSEADIRKICYENVFRVWRKVIEVASAQQNNAG